MGITSNPFLLYDSEFIAGIQGCESKSIAGRTDILFIISDDHSTQSIEAYDDRFASLNPAPYNDKIARKGIIFRQNFCNPKSTSSGATILKEQYGIKNGVLDLNEALKPENQYLLQADKINLIKHKIIGKTTEITNPVCRDKV